MIVDTACVYVQLLKKCLPRYSRNNHQINYPGLPQVKNLFVKALYTRGFSVEIHSFVLYQPVV